MIACLLAWALAQDPAQGGKLKKFEKPPAEKKKEEPSEPSSSSHSGGDACSNAAFQTCAVPVLEFVARWTILYPFLDNGLRYGAFPYADENDYFLDSQQSQKMAAGQINLRFIRVDDGLIAYGGGAALRLPSGFHFSLDVTQYREEVAGRVDLLTFEKFQFNYGPGDGPGPRNWQWTLGWGICGLTGVDDHLGGSI